MYLLQVGDFIMSLKTENVAQSMVQMLCGLDAHASPSGKQQMRIGNICEFCLHSLPGLGLDPALLTLRF
jgi:hypothetical protein